MNGLPTFVWWFVGGFAASVLLARWQYSEARSIWTYLWYQHWKMREKQPNFSRRMYQKYPRFMDRKHRMLMPYYRVKNSELGWKLRFGFEDQWNRYAKIWVRKCGSHPTVAMRGRMCMLCGLLDAGEEIDRKNRLDVLMGRAEPRPQTSTFLKRIFGERDD